MQVTMGTSPAESMAAAGNVFLGQVNNSLTAPTTSKSLIYLTCVLVSLLQTESILLIRPYISMLTLSEIHAVMTGGFASVSGTILGAFISFGVRRQMQGRKVHH